MGRLPDSALKQPNFLLITRNYPPKVGGLETYSFNLIKEFEARYQTLKLTLSRSNIHLVWFLPFCFAKALYLICKYEIKHVHLCDAMLSPIGLLLKIFTQAQVSTTVAGLDITFSNFIYQLIVPWCASKMDLVIAISRATCDECLARGISPDKCRVIPVGIRCADAPAGLTRNTARNQLQNIIKNPIDGQSLLVTVGRLVKRKGVAWFVENVLPQLDKNYLYLIVGDGPELAAIRKLINDKHLSKRAFLLGKLSDEHRNIVLSASDALIMPNIKVDGDIEGFGIVALEAGSVGLPVVASDIQGIRDAVINTQTGYLAEEGNPVDFIKKIEASNFDRESIRTLVRETFDWPIIAEFYFDALLGLKAKSAERTGTAQ